MIMAKRFGRDSRNRPRHPFPRSVPSARKISIREKQRAIIGRIAVSEIVHGRRVVATDLARQNDRLRQRELFARESGDEPAAADIALRLHAAIFEHKLAPGDREPLALERLAKDDPRARKERSRDELDRRRRALLGANEAPASRDGGLDPPMSFCRRNEKPPHRRKESHVNAPRAKSSPSAVSR